jgi:hypothetical protein
VRAKAATGEAGRKEAKDRGDQEVKDREIKNRAATGDDSRRGRHGGQRATITANAPHSGGDDVDAAAAPGSRRQDARAYNRLYDSYGNRRDGSYSNSGGNPRDRSYSNARVLEDVDTDRTPIRRRDRVKDRRHMIEAAHPWPEPFWRGGFFGSGDRGFRDDD